jgi:ER membrane protein complex subunit 2
MLEPTLDENLRFALSRGNEPGRIGFEMCRKIVAGVRESRVHRPDLARRFGSYLLESHSSRLGHELWATYEQVYVALLHYGKSGKHAPATDTAMPDDLRAAQEYCNILSAQFPESLRVKRLEGMLCEARGLYDMAMEKYDEILAEDPNNMQATKRQIALCRARGKPGEAATRLIKYVEVVCSDVEAWLQLCAIYLNFQQFKRAAFCMEELVLINPMSYLFHLRYADIMYTIGSADKGGGGQEQLRTARKYYAHALDLKPQDNLRAVYGLLFACAALGATAGSKGKNSKTDNAEVFTYARSSILQLYTQPSTPMGKAVRGMLATLAE